MILLVVYEWSCLVKTERPQEVSTGCFVGISKSRNSGFWHPGWRRDWLNLLYITWGGKHLYVSRIGGICGDSSALDNDFHGGCLVDLMSTIYRGGLLVPATVWNSAREFFFCFNSSQWSRPCSPKVRKRWFADQTAKHWVMVKPQNKTLSLTIFFRVPMWPNPKWLEWQLHWLYL